MSRHFKHLVITAAAFSLLLPFAALAQQSPDQGQSQSKDQAQDQTNDQTAQPQRRHRRGAYARRRARGNGMMILAEKLNLTDQQKEQFRQIHQQSLEQAKSIRQDSSLTNEQKHSKMLDLRKQSHQQMFALLTPEQKEQLKQMREERRKQMDKQKGAGGQASSKKKPPATSDDDDPFAGMTSDDDDGGPGNVID